MKLQTKMPLMVAFLILAMPLAIPVIAGAAPVGTFTSELNPAGQTFYGDGAVYGDGYLQLPPPNQAGDKCLQCHQGIPADFDPSLIIPDKRSYLRTGHGNMLKKVTSPPQVWKGALGEPYPTTNFGHKIDWTTGKVDLGGFCDIGGFEGQFNQEECESYTACTLDANQATATYPAAANDVVQREKNKADCIAAGGQWKKGHWTPAQRLVNIISLIGDWMSIDAPDTGITGPTLPADKYMMADGRQYGTCGSCHNAGYKANDYTRPQPFADYPNFSKSAAGGVGGSWVLNGIQCERCHDATKHYASPFTATVAKGAGSTALCSQCHIRTANYEGTANPNASTQPTAFPIGLSGSARASIQDPPAPYANFGTHLIGKQFLNSPHGLFYGSYTQIANTTGGLYRSRFSDGTSQGGCDTCHDVHQSTVVKIYPEGPEEGDLSLAKSTPRPLSVTGTPEPIRRECFACHTDKADLSPLRHPNGAGTPQGDGSDVAGACETCHMPKPGGTGLRVHVMRINTNPNYSTFPGAPGDTAPGYCTDPFYTTKEACLAADTFPLLNWLPENPGICSDPYYKTRATCIAAKKAWSNIANFTPDGTYKKAVWVDLDLACGQCHGEGGKAKGLSKWQLSRYAKGIHGASANTSTAPKAAMTAPPTVTGYTVSFIDKSTDIEDPAGRLRIAVNWGDGTIETGFAGGTFLHTYRTSGTFKIRHTATDTRGLKGYETIPVVVSGN